MASAGIRNPLSPYDNYRDCSLGICSIYCTQFCFFIFPPPPPSSAGPHSPFSPSIIALIFVLAGAFLLVSYYTILKTRRGNDVLNRSSGGSNNNNNNTGNEWAVGPEDGMEASLVGKITEYKKGGRGLIEGTECAVCLGEFREGEMLRLLPKCKHAFHLPCIDKWLKSQSSCPLCRGNVAANNGPDEDLVLVVEDGARERTVAIEGSSDNDHEGVEQFRRSDVLKFEEIQEYVRVEIDGLRRGIGSSEGDGDDKGMHIGNLLRSPVAMKRSSVSTGRFMGRGNNSVILIN